MRMKMIDRFQHYFPGNNDGIRVFFAPGRVNLIGEHTDYNGGYVLPAALDKGTYMAARLRDDNQFHLYSENFPEQPVTFSLPELHYEAEDPWGNYPKGIVQELTQAGVALTGADLYFWGNIPNGAGLSSSASIEMVTAYGLAKMAEADLRPEELAKISQRVENHFIGINSGIMDQFAVGMGRKDHALFLNCRTLETEQVPLELGDYQLVITNTNKRRGLAGSKYNERRDECERGLLEIRKVMSEVESLGEITSDEFRRLQGSLKDEVVFRRVRHIITENERVKLASRLLEAGDLVTFGELMKQSHVSLRDDYEVTGHELDVLFDAQRNVSGCIGTRMTGAGFGGCTVSIVKGEKIQQFKEEVTEVYERETGLSPSFYMSETGDGVKELRK